MCRKSASAPLPSDARYEMPRHLLRFRRTVTIILLALFAATLASARTLVFNHFDAQIQVHPDGTIEVTEVIEAQFTGAWHGIYRTIPVEYTDAEGLNYTLLLDQISATDSDGEKLKLEQNREGRYVKFKIYVPAAEDATRTILLHYRVLDALRFFQDHDELYWNVTGNEWDNAIELVTAHIELPAGVTGLRAVAYTGVTGSRTEDARVEIKDNVVDISSTRRLGYRQGLTAVVGFDKGFVHPPSASMQLIRFLKSNSPLLIPLIAFFVMLWLWWTRGRDPQRLAISVQYEPPDKLTPGECGTLVDNEAAMRDITATLVDLAVKGYLTIEQIEESHLLGLTHGKDYIFHMKKPPSEWTAARSHEQEMLSALFDAGASPDVKLSDLQNHFYTRLPAIRERIFSALMSDGYYLHRPDTVKQGYIGAGWLIGGLVIFGGSGYFANATGIAVGSFIFAGIATGLVVSIIGWFMSARTVAGARALEKVLGFEEFLGRVEKDQIERLEKTPELFEKFLPYAMALKVEKKWVQAFSGIALQPPQWYQGSYGGNFTAFYLVNDLNMMSMQAGSVMASAPRSSGGSGFGGGGGSGGGFGGGGGGGF
jgi:uncharacterized membrane protein